MTNTAYYWCDKYLGHQNSTTHPENAERARSLSPDDISSDLSTVKVMRNTKINPWQWARDVHDDTYIDKIQKGYENQLCSLDGGAIGQTTILKDTYEVALASLAGALQLTEIVCQEKVKNGFAAIRPPGHHAGKDYGRGFCYFNNVAVAARYAQVRYGKNKILIIDWDVHPSDGTNSIFYDDPNVHILNLYQKGLFGVQYNRNESGRGEGEGTKHNYPLEKGMNEDAYLSVFNKALEYAFEHCKPELVLISCGFDAHAGDKMGGLNLKTSTFSRLTKEVMALSDQYCNGQIVSLLEGGYNVDILPSCVIAHVLALSE